MDGVDVGYLTDNEDHLFLWWQINSTKNQFKYDACYGQNPVEILRKIRKTYNDFHRYLSSTI